MPPPTKPTSQERREKMAVMETAISSSLSHPNVREQRGDALPPPRRRRVRWGAGPSANLQLPTSRLSSA